MKFSSYENATGYNYTYNGQGFFRLISYSNYYVSDAYTAVSIDGIFIDADFTTTMYFPFASNVTVQCLYNSNLNGRGNFQAHIVKF